MSIHKKITVNLSETLIDEFNEAFQKYFQKRSEFIEQVVILYNEDKKNPDPKSMEDGYVKMSELNLELSQCGFKSDMDDLKQYESILSESDLLDDKDNKKRRYILC